MLNEKIPNYLVISIILIICFFPLSLPFGIPAIIYSSQVNTKIGQGDVEGARISSKKAKIWCVVAVVFCLVVSVAIAGILFCLSQGILTIS